MRIGAAQDMMVAGFDALAIMQAGAGNLERGAEICGERSNARLACATMERTSGRKPRKGGGKIVALTFPAVSRMTAQ